MYPYQNPYQTGYNPYQMGMYQSPQPTTKATQEIVKVNGKEGAQAYNMPPNSSALLLDINNPILWVKLTDGAGYPSLTAYTITPYEESPPVDARNLELRIQRLEERLDEQSNYRTAEYQGKNAPKSGTNQTGNGGNQSKQ